MTNSYATGAAAEGDESTGHEFLTKLELAHHIVLDLVS
jgi:hypothetical protein